MFDDVLRQADFITLHCPLSPETQHLFSRREFELMKPSAYLINTARGGLINEADLLQSLSSGQIAGAAIDVIQDEPPGPDNRVLRELPPNLIVTPHIAWVSYEARKRMMQSTLENIVAFMQGAPINRVNGA